MRAEKSPVFKAVRVASSWRLKRSSAAPAPLALRAFVFSLAFPFVREAAKIASSFMIYRFTDFYVIKSIEPVTR